MPRDPDQTILGGPTFAEPSDEIVRLRVLQPGKQAREVPLAAGTYRVGRGHDADVRLEHASVSRRHLAIVVSPRGVDVQDLGSAAGTFVGGLRLGAQAVRVPAGSVIALGDQRIELVAARGEASPEPFGGGTLSAVRGLRSQALSALGAPLDEQDLEAAEQASLLADLDEEDRTRLLAAAERIDLLPGAVVTREGGALDALHVVLSGDLALAKDGRTLGLVSKGQAVDLLGVLHERVAEHTVTAEEGGQLLRVPAALVREVLMREPRTQLFFERVLEWPGADRLRQQLREYGVARRVVVDLIAGFDRRVVAKGTRLNDEGDRPRALAVVDRGALAAWKRIDGAPALVRELGVGGQVGGAELAGGRAFGLAYEATMETALLEVGSDVIAALLSRSPELRTLLEAHAWRASTPPPPPSTAEEPDDEDDEAPDVEHFMKGDSPPPRRRPRAVHVRQHDEMDCGAACLAMMTQAYGRRVSLAHFRARVHVTRDGASMWSLVRAAREAGFEVTGVQASVDALEDMHLPAVALMAYHFVVVYRVTKAWVLVGDPAAGLIRVPRDRFENDYSRMALLMRPTEKLYAHPESRPGYRKYLALGHGMWGALGEVLLASLLVFVFGLVTPLFSQVVFDRVLVNGDAHLLGILVVAMSAVVAFQLVAQTVTTYLTGYVSNRFDAAFSALVYRHVMKLPLNFFMVRRTGDILTRFHETENIRAFITGETLATVIQLVSVAIYLGVLFLYSKTLGWLAVACMPILALTSIVSSRRLRRIMEAAFPSMTKAAGVVVEQIRSLETVKSLGAEVAGRWRWEASFRTGLASRLRLERMQVFIGTVSGAIEQLLVTGLLYVAAKMALRGEISVGKMIASGQFVTAIFAPVRALAGKWLSLQSTAVSAARLDDIITAAPEPDVAAGPPSAPEKLAGDIVLEDVWFQYGSDLSPWVLKGVNLTIRKGETVAVVGRSGSGKTTMVQLLNLLYRPTRGKVFIDGRNIEELPLSTVRDSIGIVMQDSQLFAGTVLDNITFGKEGASTELAMAAARVANAHGFIAAMKGGYEALVKEGGGGLSGGQRQRINIARALFRRPSILILDEATSALDSESERAVVDAMRVFCRGRTSIVIAHRLSTILHADRIVLMDDGRVVETGTHRELIGKGGAYAQLFGAQLAL